MTLINMSFFTVKQVLKFLCYFILGISLCHVAGIGQHDFHQLDLRVISTFSRECELNC